MVAALAEPPVSAAPDTATVNDGLLKILGWPLEDPEESE
jgi:hypothetical protein